MSKKYLIVIFLLSLFFRAFKLLDYPFHITMDEAAIGVAARSVSQNLRDEHGNFLPLAFYSVGDYKPPVAIYILSIFVKIFGLSEFTERLPIALVGSLTPVVIFLLLKRLKFGNRSSFLAGIWMAVIPWHVHYSRSGFEAVYGLFFTITGLWLFLKWLDEERQSIALLSAISFSLSVWSYHSSRVFIPVIILFLIVNCKRQIFITKKSAHQFFNFLLVGLAFALPLFYLSLLTESVSQRAASTSILREQSLTSNLHRGDYQNIFEFIFDNDIFLIFRHWMDKYLGYFDFRFWFEKGPVFTPIGYPDVGLLFIADIPVFLLGIYGLVKSKNNNLKRISLVLFLLGPLAASFAMNEQHPLRSLIWIIFFAVVLAQGFEIILKTLKYRYIYLYLIFLSLNLLFFKQIYKNSFAYFHAEAWQYGYREASIFACQNIENYDKIFISESFGANENFTSLPHYFLAFYCGGKPIDYITEDPLNAKNGVYIKRPLWNVDENSYDNSLFIAAPLDFPEDLDKHKVVNKIIYPNGKDAFWFVITD